MNSSAPRRLGVLPASSQHPAKLLYKSRSSWQLKEKMCLLETMTDLGCTAVLSHSGYVAVRKGLMPRGNAGEAAMRECQACWPGPASRGRGDRIPVMHRPAEGNALPDPPRRARRPHACAPRTPPLACPYPDGITPAEGHLAAVWLAWQMADKLPSLLPLPGGYAIVPGSGLIIRGGRARNSLLPLPRL